MDINMPKEIQSQDLQGLLNYISGVASNLLEINKDLIYKESQTIESQAAIKTFVKDQNTKLLCVTWVDNSVIEDDQKKQTKPDDIIFENELKYKRIKGTTISFIKKDNNSEIDLKASFSSQIQVLNFNSEASDVNMCLYLQNYIQGAFNPLFNSYQLAVNEQSSGDSKVNAMLSIQNKITELVFLLNQSQINSEIPNIKLEADPEIKSRIEEAKKKGVTLTGEDFADKLSDNDFLLRLQDTVGRWKQDIHNVLHLDRQVNQGNVIQEINFWKDYETTLLSIQKQVESPEVTITINILKQVRKFYITTSFEEDTKLGPSIQKAQSYSSVLKDLPIISLTTSENINVITTHLKKLFDYLKLKLRISTYPISRTYSLIEVLSKDINNHLIEILLKNKLMNISYVEFHKIYTQLKELFNVWENEFGNLRKEINVFLRSSGNRFANPPTSFEHQNLQKRVKELKKFRFEHENLKDIAQSLVNSENGEETESPLVKELETAFTIILTINILDLGKDGETIWYNLRNEYNKKTEKIETQISNFLKDKLATASNSNEEFRIFSKFNKLISRQRIQNAIQEFQSNLVLSISQNLKDLKDKLLLGYPRVDCSYMSKIKGIPEISGQIIWLNQFKRKIECYKERMRMVLGEGWETHNEGKNVKDIIDSLLKTITYGHKIVDNWNKDIHNLEDYTKEKIISIFLARDKFQLRVNFDEHTFDLFKEVRLLGNMGEFYANAYIGNKARDIKNIYPVAISLQDSIRTFNQTCGKIDSRIVKLVAKSKKEIQDIITHNFTHNWGTTMKVDRFSKDLCERIVSFEENVRDLVTKVDQIQILLSQITQANINSEPIQEKILAIQKVIDEISEPSNMQM